MSSKILWRWPLLAVLLIGLPWGFLGDFQHLSESPISSEGFLAVSFHWWNLLAIAAVALGWAVLALLEDRENGRLSLELAVLAAWVLTCSFLGLVFGPVQAVVAITTLILAMTLGLGLLALLYWAIATYLPKGTRSWLSGK